MLGIAPSTDKRCKEESLVRRAQSPLPELPFPTFTHQAAVTVRRQPMLAAAARMTAAGCQGAGDGASSPGNRTCYPRGIRRARGQQAPAEKEKLMGRGGHRGWPRALANGGTAESAPPRRRAVLEIHSLF